MLDDEIVRQGCNYQNTEIHAPIPTMPSPTTNTVLRPSLGGTSCSMVDEVRYVVVPGKRQGYSTESHEYEASHVKLYLC